MSTPTERILPYLEQIRDERHTAANTAVRVGNALIMLLDYISSADPSGKFLSRVDDDTAEGVITFMRGLIAKLIAHFEKGADFGTFLTGISGGKIDQYGNGELESLVLRSFLEVPELRINSISINVGDDWHTNGRGLIEWVEPDTDGQGNLLTTGTFGLHLEEGVPGAVMVGDRCKGIVSNMLDASMAEDADKDDGRGNRAFRGFYTTYFQITQVTSVDGGINNVCRYSLRPTITENGSEFWRRDDGTSSGIKGGALFHPAKSMTFAQYSHPTNVSRQSARYNAVGTNTYTRYLRNMTGWDESLANIAVQIGNTPLIAEAFPDDPRAQQAGLYSVWLDGDIFFSGNLVQVDPWGRDVVVHPDQGNFVQTGVDYYYNDLVHYNNKLYYCVYAEKDANGLYKPLRLAHVDAQHPDGINCIPGEDEHWMIYLDVEGITPGGNWRSDRVPYPTNAMVTLGTGIYISNKETSNPPVGLLKDKDGKYIVNKDGGYIIANDTVSDDWELLFNVSDITRGSDGADAIIVNLTNDTDTVFTDEHGNIPAGAALPTTQGQLLEGSNFVISGVTWTIDWDHSSGCTATINASTGVVTVLSMTADAAVIRVTATYRGKPYYRDFTFKKTFGKDKMWIVPSSNAIVYDPNDGTFSPTHITLGAYILRGAHGTPEEVTGDSIGYMLYSKLNPQTGVVETVRCYHNAQVAIDANSFINGELAVVLYDQDGVRQDAESIPMVTSGLNAKSLEARYSTTENGPWHASFQNGDKWMQTREEGGQWGQSIKIVGEDGDKYQFDFNASKDKVSQNATTPPANCALAQWQDAPLVVPYAVGNDIYPYLWMKQSEVNDDGTLSNSVYIRLTGEDGKSVLNKGKWMSNEVPYNEQDVVMLGGSSFIALRDTSNPPLGLLKDKDGNYITTKDGGYIIINDEITDDWQYLAEAGVGVKIKEKRIEYAIGTDGQNPPTSGWTTTQPNLQQGQWLWTRRTVIYTDGTITQDYSVSYAGIDPDGFESIVTDFAKTPDELVMPRDEDLVTWVPNFSDLDAQPGDFVWTRYTIIYEHDGHEPTKSFMCTRIGTDGGSVIAVEEFYLATASNTTAPAKTAQGWSETFPVQTPPNIYVWNFERTTYSDGRTPVETDVHCLNPNGKGIANIVNCYAISAYGVGQQGTGYPSDISNADWTDEVYDRAPTKEKPYQWNWERINYTDGTHDDTYHVSAVRGSDGEGFDWKGNFVPGTQYKKNEIVRLVEGTFVALRNTTNPPLGLLTTKDGNYITTKDGGYIVANDILSDDWERFAMDGSSVRIVAKRTEYAIGSNGKDRPTSGWSTTQPELQQGQWLWTRRIVEYSDGTMTEDYSVSYAGIDPDGLESITTDFAKTQDELVMPRDEDLVTWVPNYSDLNAGQGDFVWTRYTIKYDNDDREPVKSFMCTRIGEDGSSVIAMEELYLATASPSQAPSKSAQGWSENYPAQTPPYIYVWNYERTTYSDGSTEETDVHCLNPNGKGIQNIINRYAISAYGVGQQGTGYPSDISAADWTDEVYDRAPTKEKPYQWNWERINFTDATYTDTYHVSAVRGADGEGFTFKGPWKSYDVPYAKQDAVSLAGSSFIAKRQTSNPPLGLLKDKDGRYVTTKNGGYIVAKDVLSDDWDYMAEGGSKVLGENAVFVDFTNDNITCLTDAEGNMLSGQDLTATARLFDGKQVPNGSISWSLVCTDCTAAINSLTGVITILSVTGGTSVRSASVLAIATYNGKPYSKILGISKSFGAEVWDLTFTPDELIFNPNTSQFTAASVTFGAKRRLNGQSSPVTSGIGFIVVNGRTATNLLLHDGDTLTIAQLQQNYGLPENANMTNMTLRVELYRGENYSGGNWKWMDGEDLAVVVSGKAGTNGTYNKYAYAKSAYRTSQDSYHAPSDIQANAWSDTIPSPGVAEFVWQRITPVNAAGADGTPQYFCMTGLKGDTGETGHTGRWYEYAGVWGTDTSSVVNTDDHGWFVKYGDNFYMNIKDDKDAQGHYIPNTSTPSGASGSGWEQMDGIRQYFMAKAIFADYAQFGAFYINLDWMVSAYGTIDGTLYRGQYYGYAAATLFDQACLPSGKKDLSVNIAVSSGSYTDIKIVSMTKGMRILKITGRASSGTLKIRTSYDTEHEASITSTSDTSVILVTEVPPSDVKIQAQGYGYITSIEELSFVPQFAVDGKSGKAYLNDGYFRGTIYATDGEFSGRLNAATGTFAGELQAATGSFGGSVNAKLMYTPTKTVSASTYSINPDSDPCSFFIAVNTNGSEVTLPNPTTYDGIEFRFMTPPFVSRTATPFFILKYSQGIAYKENGLAGWQYATQMYLGNGIVTVKAIQGEWYVIDGGVEAF